MIYDHNQHKQAILQCNDEILRPINKIETPFVRLWTLRFYSPLHGQSEGSEVSFILFKTKSQHDTYTSHYHSSIKQKQKQHRMICINALKIHHSIHDVLLFK